MRRQVLALLTCFLLVGCSKQVQPTTSEPPHEPVTVSAPNPALEPVTPSQGEVRIELPTLTRSDLAFLVYGDSGNYSIYFSPDQNPTAVDRFLSALSRAQEVGRPAVETGREMRLRIWLREGGGWSLVHLGGTLVALYGVEQAVVLTAPELVEAMRGFPVDNSYFATSFGEKKSSWSSGTVHPKLGHRMRPTLRSLRTMTWWNIVP